MFTATSLVKLFPVIGEIIQASVAGALTEAIGFVVNDHLIKCFNARANEEPLPDFLFNYNEIMSIFEEFLKAAKK